MVTRTAFGALPIQRVEMPEAKRILRSAFDAGINFFDTARGYTDSEEKLGAALADVRHEIVIATKSFTPSRDGLLKDLETSLRNLKTDYVDILQLHNPAAVPDPDDAGSAYAGLMEAKRKGMVRFAGITNHRREVAADAIASGLFDTLQFPLNYLSDDGDRALVGQCDAADMGFIVMKAMSGGLITNARASFAWLATNHPTAVEIWGIQRMSELEEFLALDAAPPAMDDELLATIDTDREELGGEFCRGCGYCLPCPADIPIPMAARMSLLLGRAPTAGFLTDEWAERMERIENCIECGHCREHCPYELNTPELLRANLAEYRKARG